MCVCVCVSKTGNEICVCSRRENVCASEYALTEKREKERKREREKERNERKREREK